jgi:hypothetical protein
MTCGGVAHVAPDIPLRPSRIAPLLLEHPRRGLAKPANQLRLALETQFGQAAVKPEQNRLLDVQALEQRPVRGLHTLPSYCQGVAQSVGVEPLLGRLIPCPGGHEELLESCRCALPTGTHV